MDSSTIPFILLFIAFSLFSGFWILKCRTLKAQTGAKKLKTYGTVDYISIFYCLALKKYGSISGRKVSRYWSAYAKYLSKQSGYSREPQVWKLFGKPIGLSVTEFDDIMEIMKNDAFFDKAPESLLKHYTGLDKPGGIGLNNGETAKELKRFLMKKLGKVGVTKKEVLTSRLADQLPYLLDHIDRLRKQTKNKVQVKELFNLAVLNVVSILTTGKVFSEEDPDFIEKLEILQLVSKLKLPTIVFVWFFQYIPGIKKLFGLTPIFKLRDKVHAQIRDFIDEKEKLGIYRDNPNDIIDFFLQEIDKHKDGGPLKHIYCKEQLIFIYLDLFVGGMDNTSKFLESFLMFMCLYPEVQAKVQKEIDSVMGTSALPLYFDMKSKMPYTVSTILEAHRLANIIVLVPRMTAKDVEFKGHHLKKGCIVALVLAGSRFDDTYWEEPNLFRPERFLNENNEIIQERADRVLIFGTGSRVCPAESIAPVVAFTYAVGILQKYKVQKGDESEILGMAERIEPTNGPDPFHISFFER